MVNAYWAPTYDAMLTTGREDGEPTIELVRRADIVQNTGEDWTDVALTLSTTRPTGGTDAPTVGGAQVGVFDQDDRFVRAAEAEAADAAGVAGNLALSPAAVPNLQAVAAPRFSEQAYLTAALTIDSQAPILAGRNVVPRRRLCRRR